MTSTRIGGADRGNRRLARELIALRRSVDAGISELAKVSEGGLADERLSENTVRNIEDGKNVFEVSVSKYVRACRRIAEAKHKRIDSNRFDAGYWRRLWQDGEKAPSFAEWVTEHTSTARRGAETGRVMGMPPRGQDLAEVGDPFGVGVDVHRSITVDPARECALLPPYVRRGHDDELGERVEAARCGRSGMAVLVAGSSTGKTRALWEALASLRNDGGWRWWHPDESADPEAIQAFESVGPRTVVWLNETQNYLGHHVSGDPQRLARRLRELLADPLRAPVLVLGTLWGDHCHTLCRDHTSQVAKLLANSLIRVPENFAGEDLAAMRAAATDPRLSEACEHAEGGQIAQYLAGGPELIARYESATPATRAVIEVAMDAVRLGHRNILPHTLLHDAAAARMSDSSWDGLAENWFELVLAEVAESCKGARGPITPIRDRPLPSRTDHTAARRGETGAPVYQLADYLDQYGRRARANTIPPIGFWEAAAVHSRPDDQHALAQAAWARGLYRDAAQLWKNAAAQGLSTAAALLVTRLHTVFPDDSQPADWAAAHAAVNEAVAVAKLLRELRQLGAADQARTLAARATAHVPLDNPAAVADLLRTLRTLRADGQVQTLVARDPAALVALDHPAAVADLLRMLRELRTDDQVRTLAVRAATHAALDDSWAVARLLRELQKSGADDQARALAARAAAHAVRGGTAAVARLLWELRRSGVDDQIHTLAAWAAANTADGDAGAIASLLRTLRELRDLGTSDQVQALLSRNPAVHVTLDKPRAVADLLRELRALRADDQIRALSARDPASHVTLDDARGVAALVEELCAIRVDDQVQALVARAAPYTAHDDPVVVAWLLRELRKNGASQQVQALLARDPASHVTLDKPEAVADLLAELRDLGAADQVRTLAVRAAAYAAHDNPVALVKQLWAQPEADRRLQALAARAAPHTAHDDPVVVAWLLRELRKNGASQQVQALLARDPASHVTLDKPQAVAGLLAELRKLGADDQANTLSNRLPASGLFDIFLHSRTGRADQFRFGREPDGARAEQWRWGDLQ
ncbi:hypothetical protein [Nocardia wallacei]|nr:hypothetical protein [Nocardia wallacei]